MPFKDRSDAGRKLAKALAGYKKREPVILALPRGGVPVAAEVCAALKAPLDLVLVRKVGVPFQPELAMGAVVDGVTPSIVRNEDVIQAVNIDEATFNAVCGAELSEIERRRQRYLGTRGRVEVAGHTAIVTIRRSDIDHSRLKHHRAFGMHRRKWPGLAEQIRQHAGTMRGHVLGDEYWSRKTGWQLGHELTQRIDAAE